jgi:hypothetical protein
MSETDAVVVGRVLPRIASVVAKPPSTVLITWAEGEREGTTEAVDLAPMLFVYKIYKPLRDHPELFKAVRVAADGTALAWGEEEAIDISASAILDLAEQAMTEADFRQFLVRHNFTLDSAAAALGISRRLVAYYRKGRTIPRTVALACAYLDTQLAKEGTGLEAGLEGGIARALADANRLRNIVTHGSVEASRQAAAVYLYELFSKSNNTGGVLEAFEQTAARAAKEAQLSVARATELAAQAASASQQQLLTKGPDFKLGKNEVGEAKPAMRPGRR